MGDIWKVYNVETDVCLGVFYDYDMAEDFVTYQGTLGNVCETVRSFCQILEFCEHAKK